MHVIGLIALASGLFAQLLKVFVVAAREGRWRWSLPRLSPFAVRAQGRASRCGSQGRPRSLHWP